MTHARTTTSLRTPTVLLATVTGAALLATVMDGPAVAAAGPTAPVVTGQVLGVDGGPVTRGEVSLGPGDRVSARSAPVDAHGRFRITGVDPGRYRVQVDHVPAHSRVCLGALTRPGCGPTATVITIGTEDVALGTHRLVLVKPRVEGVVRGVGNRPVPNARVDSSDEELGLDSDQPRVGPGGPLRTDARGRFHFFSDDPVGVEVVAPGYQPEVVTARVGAPGSTMRAEVRMLARSSLEVRTRTGRRKATLSLRVVPAVAGADRRGRVLVRWTKPNRTVGVRAVPVDARGRAKVHLPRVKSGRRVFTVRFSGNRDLGRAIQRLVRRVR